MELEISSWRFAFELQLPRQDTGCDGRYGCDRRRNCGVVRGSKESQILSPQGQQIESDADKNQSYRKVNERDMLRVFGEEYRLQIKRIHSTLLASLHYDFGCHLRVNRTVVVVRAWFCERKRETVVRIESFRFKHLVVVAGDDMGNVVVVRPRDRGTGRDGHGCRAKAEVVN